MISTHYIWLAAHLWRMEGSFDAMQKLFNFFANLWPFERRLFMEITYTQYGDYLLPDIELTPVEVRPMNKYGRMRRTFLEENEPLWYNELALTEKLFPHLWDVSEQAAFMMDQLMTGLLKNNPPPDKKTDQMGWVQHMNMLKAQAEEIVIAELVTVPYSSGTEA